MSITRLVSGAWPEICNRWKGVWELRPPEAIEDLGVEFPALENFLFFCKNNLILGLFW